VVLGFWRISTTRSELASNWLHVFVKQ